MKILLPDGASSSPDPIFDILAKYKTIAVVGLSSNPARPSHGVSEYMQSSGYQIIPVNPNETDVLGEPSYARLEDAPQKIEIVDEAAAEKARAAGITVVMDACMLIEHKKRRQQLS